MNKPIRPAQTVLVLDLDDTLYAEQHYKRSGIEAVCRHIAELYPQHTAEGLMAQTDPESSRWLEQLCAFCGFNDSEKQSLLWVYRLHRPNLTGCMPSEKLKQLMQPFAARVLISDGRSLSQRRKLSALGLLDAFEHIMISEAWQSEKPDARRFLAVEAAYPGKTCIYVGDNTKKDFLAPNRLGWLTIGILPQAHHIHRHRPQDFDAASQPALWLDNIGSLANLIAA
ncbi:MULTISPECIES: HAD family hydrolase [Neisseria]|nr:MULTISPECIES: HAD family hydrolase [Neisseria]MBF0803997.1 HAD family hydrolase [Neisseria sp. 19428wB4_WF04]TFU43268.1 HAD family hydrolase [Neisseria sp. WF04]